MSRLEVAQAELARLRKRQVAATGIPAAGAAMVFVVASRSVLPGLVLAGLGLVWMLIFAIVLHCVWLRAFPGYHAAAARAVAIAAEVAELRGRVTAIYAQYRRRRKGERFKTVYQLVGRSVHALEEALAVGMFHERREVFVTAFMRAGVAARVTASIGSPYSCRPADDPGLWADHFERLGCDEIRQYHNHPSHDGKTRPSRHDYACMQSLRDRCGSHGDVLRTFIICWNRVREWKVFEYDRRDHWLSHEFDAAVRGVQIHGRGAQGGSGPALSKGTRSWVQGSRPRPSTNTSMP